LERTAAHLERLRSGHSRSPIITTDDDETSPEQQRLQQDYLQQSANSLKEELKRRKLPRNGRKPDLARRLAQHDLLVLEQEQPQQSNDSTIDKDDNKPTAAAWLQENTSHKADDTEILAVARFAGLELSETAGLALGRALFYAPTPIQAAVIPSIVARENVVIHSETGSGKSLAYLLPLTEQLWKHQQRQSSSNTQQQQQQLQRALILTPTRELAAQVAGIATALAPPGTVRLVAQATNLMSDGVKDRGEGEHGGRRNDDDGHKNAVPQIFVGSSKAILHSLYGDGKMPAPPTPKPMAMQFLQSVNYLVLDEVDRLLNVQKLQTRSKKTTKSKHHERPAATLTAAVERSTLGRAQIVAASATVGRPLRRELARVLGLSAQECPRIVRVSDDGGDETTSSDDDEVEANSMEQGGQPSLQQKHQPQQQHGRSVTIPETVQNYIYSVQGSSEGKLLTGAFQVIQQLKRRRRMLLVLSRSFNMSTQNAIGALRHFKIQPEPRALLDVLQADGTDQMIQVHRQVSGAAGVGEAATTKYFDNTANEHDDYFFVTGEDTVRGLHLDGLELVIVVGRPNGPDEYTHIAGRTGRAGKSGKVINVVSHENGAALKSWERMLETEFTPIELEDAADL